MYLMLFYQVNHWVRYLFAASFVITFTSGIIKYRNGD